MLSRQDHINVWLLTSDDLYKWEGGTRAITPRWPWEFIQIGIAGRLSKLLKAGSWSRMVSARYEITV